MIHEHKMTGPAAPNNMCEISKLQEQQNLTLP